MDRRLEARRGALLALLLGGALVPAAHAEEPVLRARASALATDSSLTPQPGLTPWLNLGVTLRTGGEARGWQLGADLSFHLGAEAQPVLPTATDPSTGRPRLTAAAGLRDNGSTLVVRYRPWSWGDGEDVFFTLHPFSSPRLRLGWAYPATWAASFLGTSPGSTALQLQVQREGWFAFAAVKTALGLCSSVRPLMPLVGAGVALPFSLRAEVQAAQTFGWQSAVSLDPGFFAPCPGAGSVTPTASGPLLAPASPRGLSARLVHQVGEPIGTSIDFGLYGTAPELFEEAFLPERYPGGFSSSVSLEATRTLLTRVEHHTSGDQGRAPYTLERSLRGDMVALQARMRLDWLRLHALALVRSPAAVALNDAGLWSRLFEGAWKREAGLTVGADYHLPHLGLTPGAVLRVVRPAMGRRTYTTWDSTPEQRTHWAILTSQGLSRSLPPDVVPGPVTTARGTLKWDALQWLAAVGELSYTWNPAADVPLRDNSSYLQGPDVPVPLPSGPSFHLMVQARY